MSNLQRNSCPATDDLNRFLVDPANWPEWFVDHLGDCTRCSMVVDEATNPIAHELARRISMAMARGRVNQRVADAVCSSGHPKMHQIPSAPSGGPDSVKAFGRWQRRTNAESLAADTSAWEVAETLNARMHRPYLDQPNRLRVYFPDAFAPWALACWREEVEPGKTLSLHLCPLIGTSVGWQADIEARVSHQCQSIMIQPLDRELVGMLFSSERRRLIEDLQALAQEYGPHRRARPASESHDAITYCALWLPFLSILSASER
jgi:hypothetical protein